MDEQADAREGDGRAGRSRARRRLGAFAGAVLLCLGVALARDPTPPFVLPPEATSDVDLFHQIVVGVRAGDTFYDVSQRELRAHGYPTRSVFNWRTPCYAWLIGRVTGDAGGRVVLIAVMLLGLLMACHDLLADCGPAPAALGAVFLAGTTAWCFGAALYLFTELWAGMLILFSVGALRRGWTTTGVAAGLAAVFYRELALPYATVCLALALTGRRRREALGWAVGIALFAAFLAVHAWVVHSRLTDADHALTQGWVRFGGIRFLLQTAQANVFLLLQPLWVTALYLPVAGLGLAEMKGEYGRRVAWTALAYLLSFSVIGNPFNYYWGLVHAPLLAIGVAHAPRTLWELTRTAFPRPSPVAPLEGAHAGP